MAAERLRRSLMADTTLYDPASFKLEVDPRFGEPLGYPPGSTFASRRECSDAGVHTRTFAGISGTATLGAFSIVLSGGYDDKDGGETITYTGTGGQADSFSGSGPQIVDQSFTHPDNAALKKSVETGRPVRVIRGPNSSSAYAPFSGYRYDGLYKVERAYLARSSSGFAVCRYELRRVPGQATVWINRQLNIRIG
ncbi:PUA-like domain-containing protein [Crucibulum laeve]|uniref:PUA-like domain-containing protein n=1 Tax=Crucibulum laeve TaxID=68775 RepID=A0A5C3LZK3_9AGAR|nr:PUA-like domain-containing protein [Crucibulum laeve]